MNYEYEYDVNLLCMYVCVKCLVTSGGVELFCHLWMALPPRVKEERKEKIPLPTYL